MPTASSRSAVPTRAARSTTRNNGLVYTCRGGFIDIAHVRGSADSTIALASALGRSLETGTTIEVPAQGATRRILLRPIPAEMIQRYGRLPLGIAAAEWTAIQLSIWHEIATFYGYGALPQWEKISAFSPEDLVLERVGCPDRRCDRLGEGCTQRSRVRHEHGRVDPGTLKRLEAVPVDHTRAALQAVDGAWWDSEKRIPDWTLVRRRDFETGPFLRPWRLEDASPGSKGPVQPLERCHDAGPPLVLQVADSFAGMPFRDYLTTEFEVHDALVRAGFRLPRPGSRRITQDDFPVIISVIREENAKTFGAAPMRPERIAGESSESRRQSHRRHAAREATDERTRDQSHQSRNGRES
jgi:hypothetical protein